VGRKSARRLALRIRLFSLDRAGVAARIEQLNGAGYRVDHGPFERTTIRDLAAHPPDAVVLDLAAQPSHGRDVGVALRVAAGTRNIPLVFAGGAAEKVARVQQVLPDATFTEWPRVRSALRAALRSRTDGLHVPPSALAGYSGTPLPKKLGIKEHTAVVLVNAPDAFERTLTPLPPGVTVRHGGRGARDLTIWFVSSRRELEDGIGVRAGLVGDGGLWIAWPKRASGVATDVTQNDVRRIGLASGLVDYKISAIDDTWSGLKFATRKR
jgi:hypothetical protein